jgi:hypothetical protein
VGVESSAEESGAEMSPSKGGKAPERKKGKTKERGKKKPDGWIWMESLMWGQHQREEKLAAYKKESEWHWVIVINGGHTNGFQVTKCSGSGPKQKCTAGWSSTSGSTPSFCA